MKEKKLTTLKMKERKPPVTITLKVKAQLIWHEDSVGLVLWPKDWLSGIWVSRFYLANEIEKAGAGGFGPCWPGHEGDRPLQMMDLTVLPFRKPKKVAALLKLRNRKVPKEPTKSKPDCG